MEARTSESQDRLDCGKIGRCGTSRKGDAGGCVRACNGKADVTENKVMTNAIRIGRCEACRKPRVDIDYYVETEAEQDSRQAVVEDASVVLRTERG